MLKFLISCTLFLVGAFFILQLSGPDKGFSDPEKVIENSLPPQYLSGKEAELAFKFKITNPDSSDLEIEKIVYSCSCLRGECDSLKVLPRQNTALTLFLQPPLQGGRKTASAYLLMKNGARLRCEAACSFYKKIAYDTEVLAIGKLFRGESRVSRFSLVTHGLHGDEPVTFSFPDCSSELLKVREARVSEDVSSDGVLRRESSFDLILSGDEVVGRKSSEVNVMSGGEKLVLPVSWEIEGGVKFSPPSIFLGRVQDCTRDNYIASVSGVNGEEGVRILAVWCKSPCVAVSRNGDCEVRVDVDLMKLREMSDNFSTRVFAEVEVGGVKEQVSFLVFGLH